MKLIFVTFSLLLISQVVFSQDIMVLKTSGKVEAKRFESVSVLFTDFKDFTKYSESLAPEKLVKSIHFYFSPTMTDEAHHVFNAPQLIFIYHIPENAMHHDHICIFSMKNQCIVPDMRISEWVSVL